MQALGILAGTADLVADPPGNPPGTTPALEGTPPATPANPTKSEGAAAVATNGSDAFMKDCGGDEGAATGKT